MTTERLPRVLVVDDELTMREFLEMGLGYEGFEVRTAADGPDALETARAWPPDLVILDRMLPGLDGLEICRRLRAGGDVGILMLSARGAVDDRVAGLDAGADDYLSKPFTFKESAPSCAGGASSPGG
jgi:DNA-binding response OmpR family regulator